MPRWFYRYAASVTVGNILRSQSPARWPTVKLAECSNPLPVLAGHAVGLGAGLAHRRAGAGRHTEIAKAPLVTSAGRVFHLYPNFMTARRKAVVHPGKMVAFADAGEPQARLALWGRCTTSATAAMRSTSA